MHISATVPTPAIEVNFLNDQTVGQPLTLECNVTTVKGITSRVDIIWSSNGLELKRIEGLNTINSSMYTDYYTISLLRSTDEGKTIHCDVFINSTSQVVAIESITLNVTGK